MQSKKGYTLVELLVFLAIATVAVVAFVGILVVVVQLQVRQSSAGSVEQESTALLQQLQYYTQNASLINIPINTSTSTLSLRMSSSALDPTTISVNSSGMVYLQQGSATATPLTSSRVAVSNLSFVRHTNPPSHDTVSISFTMSYNAPTNTKQFFAQSFQTAVTQVSAATFDSNILPSSTATYSLGTSGNIWNSVNNVIYFSDSNVGVGTNAPQAALDVSGGNIFVDTVGRGIKLRDPSGNCWLVTPNSSGTLQTASVGCGAP
jgi:type II secretory pathway pseudopilin PulG